MSHLPFAGSVPRRSSMAELNTSRPRHSSRVHFPDDLPPSPTTLSRRRSPNLHKSYSPSGLGLDSESSPASSSLGDHDFESTLSKHLSSEASVPSLDNVPTTPAHTDALKGSQNPSFLDSTLHQTENPPSFGEEPFYNEDIDGEENANLELDPISGTTTNLVELAGLDDDGETSSTRKINSATDSLHQSSMSRGDSADFAASGTLYADNYPSNEKKPKYPESPADVEREMLRKMDYKQRRKERQKVKIEYNITSVVNRQKFLLRLARALMAFGSPSHRIEAQLTSCSKILEVGAEFVHIPGIIICSFGDPETKTSETHFVKCSGGLSLGNLHQVHKIYRSVVHDEICARTATVRLNELLAAPPIYSTYVRIVVAFLLSALICPLAFGGSLLDMSVAGVGAIVVSSMQFSVASKSALYANVFEITMAILMSLIARGLSSIKGDLFCYTAISSAGIVSILPGYLILTSSLELASKNIVCGSVKMVYALIYTLFLGFGLQIGSDIYLLFDRRARHQLDEVGTRLKQKVTLAGTYVAHNATTANSRLNGTFVLTHQTPYSQAHIFDGCFRSPGNAWYMQPYPWWTQFFLVPIFSTLSSLANMQPIMNAQLPVMVVISCAAYAANKVANHYIFNRSDVVSAIGAFVVGVLGNTYSRKMGGTAFTSMVTGVLFLVPSGLSQAGGLTAGSGIDIGGAMIAVTIGITVGLFMSQALVYMFGSRKNAAMFSF